VGACTSVRTSCTKRKEDTSYPEPNKRRYQFRNSFLDYTKKSMGDLVADPTRDAYEETGEPARLSAKLAGRWGQIN
jgi:Txe/YoeB family toxin of Txe-Axe toxin-antitoxin module